MNIEVTGDALPWLKRIDAAQRSPRLRKVMVKAAEIAVKKNFAKLASERHGGGPFNYYADAVHSTSSVVRGSSMFVIVDHVGIRQRYYGGTIRARPGGALTIPVKGSDAEGRSASEFGDLVVISRGAGKTGFLARIDASGTMEPLFWLRKSVTQKADPTVLPPETEIKDSMGTALERELGRI